MSQRQISGVQWQPNFPVRFALLQTAHPRNGVSVDRRETRTESLQLQSRVNAPADSDPLLSIATKQVEALFNLKRDLTLKGEALTKRNMIIMLRAVLVDCGSELGKKKALKPRAAAFAAMSDTEFIAHLESQPHLTGIDVLREIGKCQLHFQAQNIIPTRKRIAVWLNRADRSLTTSGIGQSSLQPKKPAIAGEPSGWRDWVRENATDPTNADKTWAELDECARKYISDQLAKAKTRDQVNPDHGFAAGLALTAS